jgi:hypothetical protein
MIAPSRKRSVLRSCRRWQADAEQSQKRAREKRCISLGGCKDPTIWLKDRGLALPAMIQIMLLKQRLLGSAHQVGKAPGQRERWPLPLDPRIHQSGRWLQRFLNQKTQRPSDPNQHTRMSGPVQGDKRTADESLCLVQLQNQCHLWTWFP